MRRSKRKRSGRPRTRAGQGTEALLQKLKDGKPQQTKILIKKGKLKNE